MRDLCPLCGAEPLYYGLTRLICSNLSCENSSDAGSPRPSSEPALESVAVSPIEVDPLERPLAAAVAHEVRVATDEVSPIDGCMTGIADLDWLMGPLRPGELTLIEGPAGAGKTSLVLQALARAALWGHPYALISLESSEEVLLRRIAGSLARVESRRVGFLNREDARRYVQALEALEAVELQLRTPHFLNLEELLALVQEIADGGRVTQVGLDSLDLLGEGLGGSTECLRRLKQQARACGVSLLVTRAQSLSRFRLRSSGESGALPDRILALELLEAQDADRSWLRSLRVVVRKNRRGPSGESTRLDFDLRTGHLTSEVPF